MQVSAIKILGQIGGLVAGEIWKGLAEDTAWLASNEHQAAQSALADSRIDGLTVCAFLQSRTQVSPAVTLKALELFDSLGTKMVEARANTSP